MLAVNKSISYARVSYVPNTSMDGVPAGAVIGGHTTDNFPLYVVKLDGGMGYLDARNNFGECMYSGNISFTATTWNYLVVEYSRLISVHTKLSAMQW